MKKIKYIAVGLIIAFNFLMLLSTQPTFAKNEAVPTKKGLLGNWQGAYICHCPEDTQNCWCN